MAEKTTVSSSAGIKRILALIDKAAAEKDRFILAVDGNSGAGKSYLADLLMRHYDCNVFHMDDFFLQPHQRTEKRLREPGGNIDYERFKSEVISNLKSNTEFCYQLYDCSRASFIRRVNVIPKKFNIIEGVYSMHPLWNDIFDTRIFLTVQPVIQLERIRKRSGEGMLERFQREWIPLENLYFRACRIAEQCDLVIDTSFHSFLP
ncbi:MAG TPA: uridine kinase [Clostridiales bacterium]|nr:uridine kinase [Clostridiales bacterium]